MTFGSFLSPCGAPFPPSGGGACSCSLMLETPPVFAKARGVDCLTRSAGPFAHIRPCVSRREGGPIFFGHFLVTMALGGRECDRGRAMPNVPVEVPNRR